MVGFTWTFSVPLESGTPSPGGAGTDPVGVEVQDLHIVLLEVLVGNGQIRQTGEKYGNREILK